MLGGSAANFAVHMANLNRSGGHARGDFWNACGSEMGVDGSEDEGVGAPRHSCVLHTSIGERGGVGLNGINSRER